MHGVSASAAAAAAGSAPAAADACVDLTHSPSPVGASNAVDELQQHQQQDAATILQLRADLAKLRAAQAQPMPVCCACMERYYSVVLHPCKHICLCDACYDTLVQRHEN